MLVSSCYAYDMIIRMGCYLVALTWYCESTHSAWLSVNFSCCSSASVELLCNGFKLWFTYIALMSFSEHFNPKRFPAYHLKYCWSYLPANALIRKTFLHGHNRQACSADGQVCVCDDHLYTILEK